MKTKLSQKIFSLILLVGFVLSACSPQPPVTATATATATPAPTASPTITVTPSPTPRPEPLPITLENISKLQEVYRAGNGTLRAAKLSPDGQQIAISSDGTGLALLDLEGTQTKVLSEVAFHTFVWSQDGSLIIGARDNKIWVIDAVTGEEKNSFTVENIDNISNLDLSSNGISLAIGSQTKNIYIYDWTTATQITATPIKDISAEETGWSEYVAFSPDGKMIAGPTSWSQGNGNRVLVFDALTRDLIFKLTDKDSYGSLRRILWSSDGKFIATLTKDDILIMNPEKMWEVVNMRVRIWDAQSGKIQSTYEVELGDDIQWLSNTELAVLGRGIQVLDLENVSLSPIELQTESMDEKELAKLRTMQWSKDRSAILTTTTDSVQIWTKTDVGIALQTLIEYGSPIQALTWLGEKRIGYSDYAGKVHSWDFDADENNIIFEMEPEYDQQAWSPDGSLIATNNFRSPARNVPGSFMLWKVPSGESLVIEQPSRSFLYEFAWSQNGVLFGRAGDLYTIDTNNGTKTLVSKVKNFSTAFEVSPDSSMVALTDGKNISVRNTSAYEEIKVLSGHEVNVINLMWSPSGKFLASWSYDGTWIIWDMSTFEQTISNNEVKLDYWISLDGVDYLLGYKDTRYSVFDPTTLEELRTIQIPFASIFTISPDGRYIASAGEDGIVRIWAVLP